MSFFRHAVMALAGLVACVSSPLMANHQKINTLIDRTSILPEVEADEEIDLREFFCMSLNIYHEARGEGRIGQRAVAHVVLNRMASNDWPSSICEVVWQDRQFSWSRRNTESLVPQEGAVWRRSQEVALRVMRGEIADPTGGATHFHARNVRPSWSRGNRVTIGGHVFIRR